MRNAQAYVPKGQQNMVAAALRQAFIHPDRSSASQTLRHVADQLRGKWPKLGAFIEESEVDVLAHMDFPVQHRAKLHSTDAWTSQKLQRAPFFPVALLRAFKSRCPWMFVRGLAWASPTRR